MDQLLALLVIVVAVVASVRAVAVASQAVDISVLPVHRRHRVEWCRVHERRVLVLGVALTAVLGLGLLLTAL